MAAKCSDIDFENAIKAYIQGESADSAASRFHLASKRLSDELKRRGLFRDKSTRYEIIGGKVRNFERVKIPITVKELAARYVNGESINSLAKVCGVSRRTIDRRLRMSGVDLRSQTVANQLMIASTPRDDLLRRVGIAQRANRGRKRTVEERVKAAITREKITLHASPAENLLAKWLIDRGIDVVQQKAIGTYNVDIAAFPVAVEVLGGSWHKDKPIHFERSRYIFDAGWHMVFVWVNSKRSPITPAVADYVVAFLNEVSGQPSLVREYRVIRGDGQELARDRSDTDNFSIVAPGFKGHNGGARYKRSRR